MRWWTKSFHLARSQRLIGAIARPPDARAARSGVPVLIVEQNVVEGLSISDRGYVVENGAITLEGTAKELLANEQVRAGYLGL